MFQALIRLALRPSSIKESQHFSSRLLPPGLLVCHNAVGRGQNDLPELTTREEVHNPLLDLVDLHVESGGDDAALVESAGELDDDLLGAVVVHDLEFANVA